MTDNLYRYSATVTRILDGDTLDCLVDLGFNVHLKQRVRLYGINTPETRTRDLEEKKRGLAAKARLVELLAESDNEVLLESKEYGKYGRCLGYIYVESSPMSVNSMLVKEGFAVEYYGGKR